MTLREDRERALTEAELEPGEVRVADGICEGGAFKGRDLMWVNFDDFENVEVEVVGTNGVSRLLTRARKVVVRAETRPGPTT